MISFIIISDDKKCILKINNIVLSYMMKNDFEFNIVKLKSNDKLVFNNDNNKIYIIDYDSASMLPRDIRLSDWKSPIIMLANDTDKVKTLKRLQILDIINKNERLNINLYELFDICFRQLNIKSSFKYKINKNNYSIYYDNILYIYKDTVERKSVLVTENNEYKISVSLSKMHKMLPRNFVYSHKSCIVNLDRIAIFDWCSYKIVFDNGKYIELLTKSHKQELVGE